jgi:hypothetical protein
MKIGYARVSRTDQNLELQESALKAAGAERIHKDKESGAKADRVGLDEMLKTLRAGDVVTVWRLDRIARSLKDLIDPSTELEKRGTQLISLHEHDQDQNYFRNSKINRRRINHEIPENQNLHLFRSMSDHFESTFESTHPKTLKGTPLRVPLKWCRLEDLNF